MFRILPSRRNRKGVGLPKVDSVEQFPSGERVFDNEEDKVLRIEIKSGKFSPWKHVV